MTVPVTAQHLRSAAKSKVNEANMASVLVALERRGAETGLTRPHRLVHYLAQLMHESGDFRHDQEIWGPTPAQKRYDTRTDLGNTPAVDGDGFLYRGRTGTQVTGKDNYRAFRDWCAKQGLSPPDFVADPDAINSDPWEGLAPIWYWDTRGLNKWADQNDIETITKKINGGKNGLADRIDCYGRLALVVCGYAPDADGARKFQRDHRLDVDGDIGPKTRAALHTALVAMSNASEQQAEAPGTVRAAPVVVETAVAVDKPVVPASLDQQVKRKFNLFGWLGGGGSGAALSLAGVFGADWRAILAIGSLVIIAAIGALLLRNVILRAVRDIRAAIEG
jgi:putative chitinase